MTHVASPERGRSPMAVAVAALVVGGGLAALGWFRAAHAWMYAYLVGWLYWTGLSLGSLSLLLLHNLTGGDWGDAVRSRLRAAVAALPLMALLSLPIALLPEKLYEWADSSHVAQDEILQRKTPYLNVPFFQVRVAIYFAIWLGLWLMLTWQARQRPAEGSPADRRFRLFSGQGFALHGLAVTFASVDWMMSLEPHWFSTIYGVIVFSSTGLAAHALGIVGLTGAWPREYWTAEGSLKALHDLGKLLFAFLLFWAYVSFSQYFIIWHGNLPEEVVWYVHRLNGRWLVIAWMLVLLHFVLPFMLLLSRGWKRNASKLRGVALLILAMHWMELVWLVEPAAEHHGATPRLWLDAGLTLAIGGAWWLVRAAALGRQGEVPVRKVAQEGTEGTVN